MTLFFPGDKVRLVCNPAIILTVKRVSQHVEMIQVEEVEGWGWTYGYIPVQADFIDEQLKFLGM